LGRTADATVMGNTTHVLVVALAVAGVASAEDDLPAALEKMLVEVSFSNAYVGLELSVVNASGARINSRAGFACLSPPCYPAEPVDNESHSVFCFGSATKMLTAISVLRAVEQGQLELDALAEPLIDRFLTAASSNVSLRERLGPEVANVTVRHLLSMRSGVPDYDTSYSREWQLEHPSVDQDPLMILDKFVTPGFSCAPGTCGEYSTTNFVLLGLLLAGIHGVQHWEDLDQLAILPPAAPPLLSHSAFPVHGVCGTVDRMVHGLTFNAYGFPLDTFALSCTNGWTGGNWAGTTADAASLVWALWGSARLLRSKDADLMRHMTPLDSGTWGVGLPYGLGTMDLGSQLPGSFKRPIGTYIGHGGETYGFNSYVGFIPSLNVSLAVVANQENLLAVAEATAGALSLLGA